MLTFDYKDAFRFGVLNNVILDLGSAGALTAQGDVSSDIGVDFVSIDDGVTAFDDQDALVVVVTDDVRVWECAEPKSTIDEVHQVLLSHLVTEVLVVELLGLAVDSIHGSNRFDAEFWNVLSIHVTRTHHFLHLTLGSHKNLAKIGSLWGHIW